MHATFTGADSSSNNGDTIPDRLDPHDLALLFMIFACGASADFALSSQSSSHSRDSSSSNSPFFTAPSVPGQPSVFSTPSDASSSKIQARDEPTLYYTLACAALQLKSVIHDDASVSAVQAVSLVAAYELTRRKPQKGDKGANGSESNHATPGTGYELETAWKVMGLAMNLGVSVSRQTPLTAKLLVLTQASSPDWTP